MKILIIEDDLTIREEVIDWLTFEGHDVLSADDGREGVNLALTHCPQLIISDVTMPELDGYGVLLELQKHSQTVSIPFIFLSARADKSFVRHGMELGADDYVTKPFTRAELLSAINARIARIQALSDNIRQEVNQLKAKILRMVNHELKTPLVSLNLVRQIIDHRIGQLSEHELTDLLQALCIGTDRLQHVVEQIIYLTQIESGAISFDYIHETGRSITMWQLMPRVIDLARRYAYRNRESNIILDLRDMECTVWGNPDLLQHALVELLTNALNFSQENQPIFVNVWEAQRAVWISILDQGIGMSTKEIEQAQIPFEQINRDSREQQGFGLGLTVVQRILWIHSGDIQFGSVVGKGTQVTLSLPLYKPQ